jgi:hypothetical protein
MDTTTCPECGAPAEVTDRFALEGTDGPIEHVRLQCVGRHWFLLPTASLARHHATAPPRPAMPTPRPAADAPAPVSRRGGPRPQRPARRSR